MRQNICYSKHYRKCALKSYVRTVSLAALSQLSKSWGEGRLPLRPFYTYRRGRCVGPADILDILDKRKLLTKRGFEHRIIQWPSNYTD